jgi:hypothetical protein
MSDDFVEREAGELEAGIVLESWMAQLLTEANLEMTTRLTTDI